MANVSYIGELQVDNGDVSPVTSTLYGTCTSAASADVKEVSLANNVVIDKLLVGMELRVKFSYSNESNRPTLKVPGQTNALPIYKAGTESPGTTVSKSWAAGSVVSFTYTGSGQWHMNDHLDNTDRWDANSQSSAGYVLAGGTNKNMVWETDNSGNPAWRDPNLLYLGTDTDSTNLAQTLRDMSWFDAVTEE